MKIFVVGSKYAFERMPPIKEALERMGHEVTMPASYENPWAELEVKEKGAQAHLDLKRELLLEQSKRVAANDAVLAVNLEKNGIPNYIGGATFLEVFKAWELGKKVFFYNQLPEGILHDELVGMGPIIIEGDLSLVT